jgi:hypothetical protein
VGSLPEKDADLELVAERQRAGVNAKFYAREQPHQTRRERPAVVERGIR